MAQIHFVLKYTMYTMKMVPGSKEFVCLENVMMMFLALLLEIYVYPEQYLGHVQTDNVLMIQSLPFLSVEFLHCLQNQQILVRQLHRLRDSQKYVPLMNLLHFRLEANCSLQYCQRLWRLWCSSRMQSSPWWHLRQNWH